MNLPTINWQGLLLLVSGRVKVTLELFAVSFGECKLFGGRTGKTNTSRPKLPEVSTSKFETLKISLRLSRREKTCTKRRISKLWRYRNKITHRVVGDFHPSERKKMSNWKSCPNKAKVRNI